jgi:hypothetical protein
MKTLEATLKLINEKTENYLAEPYYELIDGRRVHIDDVAGADWRDNDGQIEAAFAVARQGKGELICLAAGDDNVWLTTADKIKRPRAKVKRKQKR